MRDSESWHLFKCLADSSTVHAKSHTPLFLCVSTFITEPMLHFPFSILHKNRPALTLIRFGAAQYKSLRAESQSHSPTRNRWKGGRRRRRNWQATLKYQLRWAFQVLPIFNRSCCYYLGLRKSVLLLLFGVEEIVGKKKIFEIGNND